MQEFQPLRRQLSRVKIDTCRVAARPSKASDKAKFDRVFGGEEDDGDRRDCRIGRHRRCVADDCNHGDPSASKFRCQRRQPIELTLPPAVFDRYGLALDIAGVFEALAKSAQAVSGCIR